jgi:hypothetical protein
MLKKSHGTSIPLPAGLGKMNGLLRSGKSTADKNKFSAANPHFVL